MRDGECVAKLLVWVGGGSYRLVPRAARAQQRPQSAHDPALLTYAQRAWEQPRTGWVSSFRPENISKTRSPSMILSAICRSPSTTERLMPGVLWSTAALTL